jgi:hypothetical protein
MKQAMFFPVVALSIAAFGAHGESPADFALRQPLAASGEHAFLRVELPDSVYEGAVRPDLGDLRVFNADGAIVPFAFIPRSAPTSVASPRRELAFFPLTVDTTLPQAADFSIKLRRDSGGTTVDVRARDGTALAGSRIVGYLIDAGADEKPLVGVQVQVQDTSSVNARLRVDASDDLDHWRSVVASAPLLSLEFNGRRLARNRVEFAPQSARYLRLTWLTSAPPLLAAIQGDVGDVVVEPPRRTRKVDGVADPVEANAYLFDLGAALPVDRITLALPEVNTVAPLTWEGRVRAEDPWRLIGSSVVYRLRQDEGEAQNAEFPVVRVPLRFIRARIDPNSGGVGRSAPALVASWIPQEIVFAARGNGPFELAYGSRRALPATLAIGTLVPGYVADKPLPGSVGTARPAASPSAANAAALREPLDLKRWMLWGSLVAAALLLLYMALRLAQQVRAGDASANGGERARSEQ